MYVACEEIFPNGAPIYSLGWRNVTQQAIHGLFFEWQDEWSKTNTKKDTSDEPHARPSTPLV